LGECGERPDDSVADGNMESLRIKSGRLAQGGGDKMKSLRAWQGLR
jgi:hypothetical protein